MKVMDILDVGRTIEEFRKEWNLKYSPNDFKFWAPLLDSELPTQKALNMRSFEDGYKTTAYTMSCVSWEVYVEVHIKL